MLSSWKKKTQLTNEYYYLCYIQSLFKNKTQNQVMLLLISFEFHYSFILHKSGTLNNALDFMFKFILNWFVHIKSNLV